MRDCADVGRHVLGLGDPHARGDRGGLQPRRLPPRHGLAARHRDDRVRAAQVRLRRRLRPVFEALLEAASDADGYRLPELFAGFSRTEFETPVPYPVACQPQAWAAGAIPYLTAPGSGSWPTGSKGGCASPPLAAALAQPRRGAQPARRRLAHRPAVRARGHRRARSRSPTRGSRATSRWSWRSPARATPASPDVFATGDEWLRISRNSWSAFASRSRRSSRAIHRPGAGLDRADLVAP